MRCRYEHQGGPRAGVGRPMTIFAQEKVHLFFHESIAHQFFCDSCCSAAAELPAMSLVSVLVGSAGCCFTPTYGEQNFQATSTVSESVAFRWQLLQNSPVNRIPLSSLPLCAVLGVFSGIFSPFGMHSHLHFPLIFLPFLFSPPANETYKALKTEPGSLASGMEPLWKAVFCSGCISDACTPTLWGLFGMSIVRYSKRSVEQITLSGPG